MQKRKGVADSLRTAREEVAQLELQLLRANEQMRLLQLRFEEAGSAGTYFWEVDARGVFTYASAGVEQVLGFCPDDLVGRRYFYDLFDGAVRDETRRSAFETFAAKASFRGFRNANRHKNGSIVYLSTSGTPLLDERGALVGCRCVNVDITGAVLAEEALVEGEARYSKLFHNAVDGVCVADAESGVILDCNEALAELVKRSRAEILGQPQRILHPSTDPQAKVSPTFDRHRKESEGQVLHTQVVSSTGQIREVDIKAKRLTIGGRKVLQGVFHDVTDRVRAEQRLREALHRQDLLIAEKEALSRALEQKNSELLERDKAKSALLSTAAHDIRSPVGLIDMYCRLLSAGDLAGEDERQAFLEKLSTISRFLVSLVGDLLDVAAIESGEAALELQAVGMAAFVRDRGRVAKLLAEARNIDLVIDCLASVPPVALDQRRMEQVLFNLLSNAVKFSSPGGQVHVTVAEHQEQVVLSVRDQGPGIPEREQHVLFQPFGRTSVRPHNGERSTGLGLAIVRRIVEDHGGTIQCDSRPGEGSTFRVLLPATHEGASGRSSRHG